MSQRSKRRYGTTQIAKVTAVAAVSVASLATAPYAGADSALTLSDPWTSSCNRDKVAVDKQQMTRADGFSAGQVTAYYSPSCGTNWIEVYTPIGIDNRDISVTLFIGLSAAPWTNDRSEYRYGDGPLTNEFRSMMISAPGATCVHYYAAVSDIGGDASLLGTSTDKKICG